jgi:uncharacterized membrane protein YkvA (DUF1232 family)
MKSLRERTTDFLGKAKLLYQKKADQIAGKDSKLKVLLQQASDKLRKVSNNPQVEAALEPIKVFKRMLIAHRNGSFKVSPKTIGLLVLGLVYFVMPMDIIPDFLPVLGFADDLSVIIAIYESVKHEVDDFLAWEASPGK